jgi:parafibromin
MKQAREHGLAVGFVSVTERKHVVDWLERKVQEGDRIAPLACAYTVFFFVFDFLPVIESWFF